MKIICFLQSCYHPRIIGDILKYKQKTTACSNEIKLLLIIMKMRLKMRNSSYRYNTNRPRLRHRHKYTKYKTCLGLITVVCIKQHLSNILSSVNEKATHAEFKKNSLVKKVRISVICGLICWGKQRSEQYFF